MKRKNIIAVIICVFGILLIIGGLTLTCFADIKKKNDKNRKMENEILAKYDIFKKNAESFNDFRSKTYYNEVSKNLYIESVESDYTSWIKVIEHYTDTVDKVEESSNFLKNNCVNKYYSNESVRNKCDAFVIAYETTINYYTKDIMYFNELISSYLKTLEKESETIKLYEYKYNYMDINSDGKFIGKD